MLRYVLANSGADKSATLTITEEWANSHSIARLWAEYEVIARRANQDRYAALVAGSGLSVAEAGEVLASTAWGPLMAAFRDAESRGLDLNHAVPVLVQGRTISGADDIAAVIHGRVTKWIKASSVGRQSDSVVGLGPAATQVGDPDIEQALEDRRRLIEQRTRALASAAVEEKQRWTLKPGRPEADLGRRTVSHPDPRGL